MAGTILIVGDETALRKMFGLTLTQRVFSGVEARQGDPCE